MENYRGYRIEKTENGYRITLDNDSYDKHTHIKSKGFCRKLIDYVVDNKVPTKVNNYILESCIRLSNDENYKRKVSELLESRKHKTKQFYYNPGIKKYF